MSQLSGAQPNGEEAAEDEHAEEDTVEYWLFPTIDSTTAVADLLNCVFDVAKNYLWHDEPFRLCERDVPERHFYGRTRYGENCEDEWFVVFILYHLSGCFPDIVIKCRDGDGEFLLINAADVLPRWLNPSTAKNRVFVYRGALHVIPRPKDVQHHPHIPEHVESATAGARLVRGFPELTRASPSIQLVTNRRIDGYPKKMEQNWHYASVLLPELLVKTVRRFPQTVSPAIQAFYLRDPIDYKACRELKNFFPCKLKKTRVRFTKHLYAMVTQQSFFSDRRSPWHLPPKDDPLYKASTLGLKLTAGFEILCNREQAKLEVPEKRRRLANAHHSSEWERFCNDLKKSGFFQGEREGSVKHRQLTISAREFFESNFYTDSADRCRKKIQQMISEAAQEGDLEDMVDSSSMPDDDESWLTVTPEMLDDAMRNGAEGADEGVKEAATYRSKQKPPAAASSSSAQPHQQRDGGDSEMTDKVTKFLRKTSSYQGVTLPADDNKLSFEPERFSESVKRILDLDIPQSSSESDSSEFGDDEDYCDDLNEEELQEMLKIDKQMNDYMKVMDSELSATAIGRSFVKKDDLSPSKNSIDEEDDDFQPVDIDRNLVSNMLQSYWSEHGAGGPASALLRSLKVNPPATVPEETAPLDSDDENISE